MFTNTGWRIGWAIGTEELLWPMTTIATVGTNAVATPLQIAFAMGLETELKRRDTPDCYFRQLRAESRISSNRLVSILRSVGADVIEPTAGYCVVADFSKVVKHIDLSSQTDPQPNMKLYKYLLINEVS